MVSSGLPLRGLRFGGGAEVDWGWDRIKVETVLPLPELDGLEGMGVALPRIWVIVV